MTPRGRAGRSAEAPVPTRPTPSPRRAARPAGQGSAESGAGPVRPLAADPSAASGGEAGTASRAGLATDAGASPGAASAAARLARAQAAALAVDPAGLGGAVLRGPHGPDRDRWLAGLQALLAPQTPWRRLPLHADDDRLLGGLDLAATLAAGRPVAQRGLLAEADGGVIVAAMAERLAAGTAARLAAAMDRRTVVLARDGLHDERPARWGLVALDESAAEGEAVPAALADRLALWVDLAPGPAGDGEGATAGPEALVDRLARSGPAGVARARQRLPALGPDDATVEALCSASAALGVASLRAPILALRLAAVLAALDEAAAIGHDHAALAARWVLGPRATRLPATADGDDGPADEAEPPPPEPVDPADPPPPSAQSAPPPAAPPDASPADATDPPPDDPGPPPDHALDDLVLAAAAAAIPPGLLAALQAGRALRSATSVGRSGSERQGGARGRPAGTRRGEPARGARLNLLATLRAAAPWQVLRSREAAARAAAAGTGPPPRVHVRRDDFHVTHRRPRTESTTLFIVDASGSQALNRLAEAKGAVELLLADCYVRRDQVAVLGFRGRRAELLLPPTRSLVRAKRSLGGLPGGGGTPLACALRDGLALVEGIRRQGQSAVVVLLTDGRANIALDGSPGRPQAQQDAMTVAAQWRACGATCLLLDTSSQPHPMAAALAQAMGASYLPLPHAGAQDMSQVVRTVAGAAR